jgi:hypothetical protein
MGDDVGDDVGDGDDGGDYAGNYAGEGDGGNAGGEGGGAPGGGRDGGGGGGGSGGGGGGGCILQGSLLFIVKIFLCGIFMVCGGNWLGHTSPHTLVTLEVCSRTFGWGRKLSSKIVVFWKNVLIAPHIWKRLFMDHTHFCTDHVASLKYFFWIFMASQGLGNVFSIFTQSSSLTIPIFKSIATLIMNL